MNKLTDSQVAEWRKLSDQAKQIETLLSAMAVSVVQSSIADGYKLNVLDWITRADSFRGLSYFCAPQSEWLGGDSTDAKNFCYRLPHIAKG